MIGSERVARTLNAARQAATSLSKRPAFTLPVLLTLTLAIAAAVVAFAVVDNVLLKPLPYPNQESLVDVAHEAPGLGLAELGASPAIYFTYRDHNESLAAIGLWDSDDSPATVTGAGDPETVTSLAVTHEVLPLLGTAALRGRVFAASDDEPGSAPTVILSHGYWQRRFGGADVLGRTLTVQGVTREVVGVLPSSFRFFDYEADVLYPLQPERTDAAFGSFDGRAIARLRDGVTLEQASADVRRMIPILAAEFPPVRASLSSAGFAPDLRSLKDSVVRDLGDTLWVLFGTTAILLLVACASVANLVLLRNDARRHEVAIRMALGAGTARIGRLVAAEGGLLALAAGALGLVLAAACLPLVLASSAHLLPGVMAVRLDARVVLFALALAVGAGLVLSLAPVLRFLRANLVDALHRGAGTSTVGRERHRVRHALVVTQVALAVLLLIGSGLMWRTFAALRDVPPGFDEPGTIQTFRLTLPSAGEAEQTVRAQQTIAERLTAVSGVQSAAFASFDDGLPLDGDGRSATVEVEARERGAGSDPVREIQFVSPGFMETLRTPLVTGRTFDWTDVYEQPPRRSDFREHGGGGVGLAGCSARPAHPRVAERAVGRGRRRRASRASQRARSSGAGHGHAAAANRRRVAGGAGGDVRRPQCARWLPRLRSRARAGGVGRAARGVASQCANTRRPL